MEFVRTRHASRILDSFAKQRVLEDAIFTMAKGPQKRRRVCSGPKGCQCGRKGANLVFLGPDNGDPGRRLTKRHVALAEIAALAEGQGAHHCHHQSGRKAEVKYLADKDEISWLRYCGDRSLAPRYVVFFMLSWTTMDDDRTRRNIHCVGGGEVWGDLISSSPA
jgi:hypothetical protein